MIYQEVIIPKLKHIHNYGDWEVIIEPTEEKEGEKQQVCVDCKDVIKEQIPKLEHYHVYESTIETTEKDSGATKVFTTEDKNKAKEAFSALIDAYLAEEEATEEVEDKE